MGALHDDDYEDVDELEELIREPHFPLGHTLMRNAVLLRAAGLRYPPQQRLGNGTFGAAYHLPLTGGPDGDGSVLKITRDPTEVQASMLLRGRESRRIVPIYGVWYLRNSYEPGLRRWYAVHRGYLHPMNPLDKQLVEMIFALYDDTDPRDLTIPRSPKQHAMIDKWRVHLREELGGQGGWTDHEGETVAPTVKVSTKHLKRSMQLLLQIGSAVDEMHKAGIDWEDIHSDNLMRDRHGRLVIADVGWGLLHEDFDMEVPALTPEVIEEHFKKFGQ